ncbi:hypothetical protein BJ878DRAFT_104862 [Calycina marina]|uniref:Chromo domain-containing protein n=1 Tax=Calycina marina TaxID=1763456 RepID=A0A9P7Z1N1_9HELO|nr:hypothetical protein BJ878DRAFT_104862 [Calycina marina]
MATAERKDSNRRSRLSAINDPPLVSVNQDKKRKRKLEPVVGEPDVYFINRIVDQKQRKGETHYLIHWKDNPITGEAYSNSWEPARNVTKPAIKEWQKAELYQGTERRNSRNSRNPSALQEPQLKQSSNSGPKKNQEHMFGSKEPDSKHKDFLKSSGTGPNSSTNPDIQSIRSINHLGAALRTSENQRPAKTPRQSRRAGSFWRDEGRRVKDSLEDDKTSGQAHLVIELPKRGQSSNRQDSSQSQVLQQSQLLSAIPDTELPSQPETTSTTPLNSRKLPFIWDEDRERVIPDSQDISGLLSNELTDIAASEFEISSSAPFASELISGELPGSLPCAQIRHNEPPQLSAVSSRKSVYNSLPPDPIPSSKYRRAVSVGSPTGQLVAPLSRHDRTLVREVQETQPTYFPEVLRSSPQVVIRTSGDVNNHQESIPDSSNPIVPASCNKDADLQAGTSAIPDDCATQVSDRRYVSSTFLHCLFRLQGKFPNMPMWNK